MDPQVWACLDDFESRMMYLDAITCLPDVILTKVDRAAMRVSLGTRVSFPNHRVVKFACRLPLSMKMRRGQGKRLLCQALYRNIPRELVERLKTGFDLLIGDWLRGPLREWAETLLDERRLAAEGFFHLRPIHALWAEHLAMRCNWVYRLWDVRVFQSWLEREQGRG